MLNYLAFLFIYYIVDEFITSIKHITIRNTAKMDVIFLPTNNYSLYEKCNILHTSLVIVYPVIIHLSYVQMLISRPIKKRRVYVVYRIYVMANFESQAT